MLQVRVGGVCEALLLAAGGVEAYEVARYVLHLGLGALLYAVPGPGAELVYLGGYAFLAPVLGEFVQGVDGAEDDVVAGVYELYHLLRTSGHVRAHQAAEAAHAVVYMHYVVAHLYLPQLLEGEGEFSAARPLGAQVVFVETVENLMVGEEAGAGQAVGESLVEGAQHGSEGYVVPALGEYGAQAVALCRGVGEDEYAVSLGHEAGEGVGYEVEILVV